MRHKKVAKLVKKAYTSSNQDFAKWTWKHHVQVVAQEALSLSQKHNGKPDLAVTGAWLHDFGDAFLHRHAEEHEKVSTDEAQKVLTKADYSENEIQQIIEVIIAPHSCKENNLPQTLEGKILATADAVAHLNTDFYIQFTWKHLPESKTYNEFIEWVQEKLDRDYNDKIFFKDIKESLKHRYLALKEVYS